MEVLIEFLKTLNGLSPLAIIGLLAIILFFQAKNKVKADGDFETLTGNHLHELPAILETLQRIEVANATGFATILAKLNGGAHK